MATPKPTAAQWGMIIGGALAGAALAYFAFGIVGGMIGGGIIGLGAALGAISYSLAVQRAKKSGGG